MERDRLGIRAQREIEGRDTEINGAKKRSQFIENKHRKHTKKPREKH
jgi:hypothetical protein